MSLSTACQPRSGEGSWFFCEEGKRDEDWISDTDFCMQRGSLNPSPIKRLLCPTGTGTKGMVKHSFSYLRITSGLNPNFPCISASKAFQCGK